MTQKVFALDTKPGIQRDGTIFDKQFYNDGRWVRFQRGRPRKMGGYRVISDQLTGPSRGIWVNAQNAFNYIFSGYNNGLQVLTIDDNGIGAGINNFTLSNFTASNLNLWQFDGFYDVAGAGVQSLLAHPGQNLASIDNDANTPVLIGDINGTTMSQIGTFTDTITSTGTAVVTIAASNPLIGAGQTVTGTSIPANTTVVSVSTTNVTLSNVVPAGVIAATFNNNISVSGGLVSLHPYIFVYGNNGLIQNCSAGNAQDWVSADANAVNVATGKIVQGLPVRGGSNAPSGLFWSLDSLVRVSYIGGAGSPPQYWRYDIISSQSSILSSQSAIEYDGVYYWCGVDRFLMYNGVVKEIPNNMNQNYFFDNLNYSQRQKVWASKVPRFGEVWWFYPKGDATECTDAIVYNTRENTWYDAGEALGARRSAGYFSQVFHYPVQANWETSSSEIVFTDTFNTTNGSTFLYLDTYNPSIVLGLVISGSGILVDTYVSTITTSNIKTLGTITGGAGYVNGTYTNVTLTGGGGKGAKATVTVTGGNVTAVTLTSRGASYQVGDVLSASNTELGGAGAGFSVPVTVLYAQAVKMSAAATATATVPLQFSTPENRIEIFQHEIGTDAINGQNVNAIESYFETNDLGWVSGGPSEPAMTGMNKWIRLERVEPDFVLNGNMTLYITGRPYAQSDDAQSVPFVFDANTNKIDMKEQRRELRLKFVSNEAGGDYQLGRVLLNADIGDVRGY
ncbi:MAG: hypothetical protein EBU08_05940 [Micrococcales bacterium]|nr:hypothetical protein [Micrococcales bacterium]